jgi:hypothetical protein
MRQRSVTPTAGGARRWAGGFSVSSRGSDVMGLGLSTFFHEQLVVGVNQVGAYAPPQDCIQRAVLRAHKRGYYVCNSIMCVILSVICLSWVILCNSVCEAIISRPNIHGIIKKSRKIKRINRTKRPFNQTERWHDSGKKMKKCRGGGGDGGGLMLCFYILFLHHVFTS